MKVLLFIESAGIGGAERMVLEMLSLLRGQGVDASFLGVRKGWLTDELKKRQIPVNFVETADKLSFHFKIAKVVKDSGADLVNSHSLDTNFHTALAAKVGGFKHLATEHGDVHHSDKRRNLESKLKVLKFLGTEFNAVSEFSKSKLSTMGIAAKKISTIANPVNLNIEDHSQHRDQVRAELGISKEDWLWIHVANLRPVKDQHTLIKGFAESFKTNKEQALAIAGDGDLRPELESLAKELGVDKQVHFLGFTQDAPKYLAASDGFILSSLSEAMPMSLLEAAAMRLVLVGSSVGGIPEVINKDTGYLFEAKNYKELAERLNQIVLDRDEAKQKAENSFMLTKSTYSAESIATSYLERYKEILC